MKKTKGILTVLFLAAVLISALCVPAFALTEGEVEAQVAASGKEAVTGNMLIWFLCAVAFLKVSQKIDSFMATLGVNVGRTGGSLLAEAMIAMRTVTMVMGGGHGGGAGRAGSTAGSSAAGRSGSSGMGGFFKGGLIGMAGRHITNSAVRTATTQTSAVHTAQSQVQQAAASNASAAQSAADAHINSEVHTGGSTIHTENSTPVGAPPQTGVIQTGSEAGAQAVTLENTPPVTPMPGGMPPQEGVILTGSEPPASVPAAELAPQPVSTPPGSIPTDPAAQIVDAPPESIPVDLTPPQEGVILTGGESTVHAPQTENIFAGGTEGTAHVDHTAVTGNGQHTQAHTERAQASHTSTSSEKVQTNRFLAGAGAGVRPTLGGMVFSHSLAAGGSFANDVIGTVARGEVAGSITGDMAAQSLSSYMGYASPTIGSREAPVYSDVEIGRGRITGVETTAGASEGRAFAMYHTAQYTTPSGEYTKVVSADGTQWYKQYAQDAVERKPYKAPDDTVAYHERIIKKLPDPPKRRDRI